MLTYADEITFGESIPELGTGPEATLKDVILKLVEVVFKQNDLLQRELFPVTSNTAITAKDIAFDDPDSGNLSIEAQKIQGSEIKVKMERGSEAATLSYDLEEMLTLPEGSKIASAVVNISGQKLNGRTQVVPASKQKSMSVSIGYNRFPVTLDARVVVLTKDDGEVELRKTIEVKSEKDITQTTPYEVIDRTSAPATGDLESAIKRIAARVTHLETKKA